MLLSPALTLVLALAPVLSPEAVEHNAKAMYFYDAGQFAQAFAEFHAAYLAMPDARRDLEGRQQLLGSMSFALRDLHAQTGEAAPLCRLQAVFRAHIEVLVAAFPEDPGLRELVVARARHQELTRELAALGPHACDPPPAPVVAPVVAPGAAPVSAAPTSASTPVGPVTPPADGAGRKLRIAGGVLLPLGVAALVGLAVVGAQHRSDMRAGEALHAALALRPCTADDRRRMTELVTATRREEGVMLGLGLAGAALVSTGTALLVRGHAQRRRPRLGFAVHAHHVGLTLAGEF